VTTYNSARTNESGTRKCLVNSEKVGGRCLSHYQVLAQCYIHLFEIRALSDHLFDGQEPSLMAAMQLVDNNSDPCKYQVTCLSRKRSVGGLERKSDSSTLKAQPVSFVWPLQLSSRL
jgi:hypothetical protein